MRVPKEIIIDRHTNKVLIDGLPFIYPLAEEGARPEFHANGIGIVWLPLICDMATFKAGIEVEGRRAHGQEQSQTSQRA